MTQTLTVIGYAVLGAAAVAIPVITALALLGYYRRRREDRQRRVRLEKWLSERGDMSSHLDTTFAPVYTLKDLK